MLPNDNREQKKKKKKTKKLIFFLDAIMSLSMCVEREQQTKHLVIK